MGTPLALAKRGRSPTSPLPRKKFFGPCLLWPNGWIDQDGTWHGNKPQPRRGWRPSPSPKGGGAPFPIFGPFLLWPKGRMHQDATWYGGRPQPRGLCVRWGGDPAHPLNFRPMFIIVIVILLEHCAMHSLYCFVQVQVLVSYAFYF